jgi:hypothetical protein
MEAAMKRLLAFATLAASLSMLAPGSAAAHRREGARKAPIFGPNLIASGFSCSLGALPTPDKFGFVVMNTSGHDRFVSGQVALKRAAPNAIYGVALEQDPGGCLNLSPLGVITTNARGNGNLHFVAQRIPTATEFWVGVATEGFGEVFGSAALALD